MISKFKSYIRANDWWMFKAAPILGFAYFYCYLFDIPFVEQLKILFLSAMTIIGIAGLGYAINDWNDREVDKRARKKNPFEKTTNLFALFIFGLLFTIALVPWIWLKSSPMIWITMGFQLFLFLVYAHPLTRLKEKSYWGPICDALYGHAVPIIIACLTYQQYLNELPYNKWWFFGSLFFWQFFKGLRNILLHQLDDYENDIASGITTLTTLKGKNFIMDKIPFRILPLEILSFILFLISITKLIPTIWIILIFFLVIYLYGHGLLEDLQKSSSDLKKGSITFFLNDFYETYVPIYFLILCTLKTGFFIVVAGAHFILFPSVFYKIYKDLQRTKVEIWNNRMEPYLYYVVRKIRKGAKK